VVKQRAEELVEVVTFRAAMAAWRAGVVVMPADFVGDAVFVFLLPQDDEAGEAVSPPPDAERAARARLIESTEALAQAAERAGKDGLVALRAADALRVLGLSNRHVQHDARAALDAVADAERLARALELRGGTVTGDDGDDWMPIREAAERAGETFDTVRGWARRKNNPLSKRPPRNGGGRGVLVRLAEVLAWKRAKQP
jgi:hypothetical protein